MNSFYLYSFKYKISEGKPAYSSATVIFCSSENIDEAELQAEVRTFYQQHYQPDEIFVLGSKNVAERLKEVFIKNQETTFKGIPKKQETHLYENIFIVSFDKDGKLNCENEKKVPEGFLSAFINDGLQQIFTCRGGLIVSEDSHHYVFPSGKHCDRFLRTGNILLYSPEIYFIAFSLLRHFNEELFSRIYCDTSSINSIAFALFDLKNSFLNPEQKMRVSIESFSSYDGLYKNEESYTKDSFLLISASTSSNIVKYVLDNHKILERDNVVILYYLGKPEDFNHVRDQVLCNLTKSDNNENGIPFYRTYLEKDCEFCKKGSFPVPVSGDVFLLEKPKVNKILLSVTQREKNLSEFVGQFRAEQKKNCVFKSHFKEDSPHKYEVYIDFVQVLKSLDSNRRMDKFKARLDDYIIQYVPANTGYIVHLNDDGSKDFGQYIFDKIAPLYDKSKIPALLTQDKITQIPKETTGSILVVGSCISNGKNLLYISRALRKYDKLKIIYFNGIARSSNEKYLKNLSTNLQRGKYGAQTNSFIAVQTLYCSSSSRKTPWTQEIEFLKSMVEFINNKRPDLKSSIPFFAERRKFLEEGSGELSRGISEKLFYPMVVTTANKELSLRKNFAFFDFEYDVDDITQSDVYFTICNIINTLRNSDKHDNQLKQAVYVRNLIDPHNFSRFNDGVIQASLLRSSSTDELAYAIDNASSQEMYNTLETMITYYKQEQGEALLEFLYAIAVKKLTFMRAHLVDILALISKQCKEEIFECFRSFIQEFSIDEPERLRSEPFIRK
jgi:hypothetical protein